MYAWEIASHFFALALCLSLARSKSSKQRIIEPNEQKVFYQKAQSTNGFMQTATFVCVRHIISMGRRAVMAKMDGEFASNVCVGNGLAAQNKHVPNDTVQMNSCVTNMC